MQQRFRIKNISVLFMSVVMLFSLTGCVGMMGYVLAPSPTPTASPTASPTPRPTPAPTPSPTPAPDVNAFRIGLGTQDGYFSRFFDFGFQIPDDWYYYNRSNIDELNMIQTPSTDRESYFKEYITRLKKGEVLYDFVAYRDKANELILVYMKDYSKSDERDISKQEVLDYFAESFFDRDDDGIRDALNIRSDTVWLNKIEQPLYFFEQALDDAYSYSAMMVIQQGTTFAIVLINCPDQAMTEKVVYSIYPTHIKIK